MDVDDSRTLSEIGKGVALLVKAVEKLTDAVFTLASRALDSVETEREYLDLLKSREAGGA